MNLIPAFFIIDQENIGIRKKHAIKHTTYGITPYICVVKHNCKANMVKRLFKRYIDLLGVSTLDNLGLPRVVNLTMKKRMV